MREIKFRAWDGVQYHYGGFSIHATGKIEKTVFVREIISVEQFTGLHDKNGLTDIYEGDILSLSGEIYANIHEKRDRREFDFAIEGLGTKTWRDTEQEAIKRGCKYAE